MVSTLVESQEWEAIPKTMTTGGSEKIFILLRNLTVENGMFYWDLLEVFLSIKNMAPTGAVNKEPCQ